MKEAHSQQPTCSSQQPRGEDAVENAAKKAADSPFKTIHKLYAVEQRNQATRSNSETKLYVLEQRSQIIRQRTTKNNGHRLREKREGHVLHLFGSGRPAPPHPERAARHRGPGAPGDAVQTDVRRAPARARAARLDGARQLRGPRERAVVALRRRRVHRRGGEHGGAGLRQGLRRRPLEARRGAIKPHERARRRGQQL